MPLFESFYNQYCALLDNSGKGALDIWYTDEAEDKGGTPYVSICILTLYIIQKKKEKLDNKGMDYLVPSDRIINNNFIPNNVFPMLVHKFTGIITVTINPHNIFKNKLFYYFYDGCAVIFLKEVQVYHVPPSPLSPRAFCLPFPILLSVSEFISGMRCRGGVFLFVFVCWREGSIWYTCTSLRKITAQPL